MNGLIRPWYRSRLFWLGVPGLLFLMWLWWICPRCITWVTNADKIGTLNNSGHALDFAWSVDVHQHAPWQWHFQKNPDPTQPIRFVARPILWEKEIYDYGGFTVLRVAHWFLLLLYLAAWLGLLFWRQRRKVRSTKPEPVMSP